MKQRVSDADASKLAEQLKTEVAEELRDGADLVKEVVESLRGLQAAVIDPQSKEDLVDATELLESAGDLVQGIIDYYTTGVNSGEEDEFESFESEEEFIEEPGEDEFESFEDEPAPEGGAPEEETFE